MTEKHHAEQGHETTHESEHGFHHRPTRFIWAAVSGSVGQAPYMDGLGWSDMFNPDIPSEEETHEPVE